MFTVRANWQVDGVMEENGQPIERVRGTDATMQQGQGRHRRREPETEQIRGLEEKREQRQSNGASKTTRAMEKRARGEEREAKASCRNPEPRNGERKARETEKVGTEKSRNKGQKNCKTLTNRVSL